VRRSLLAVVGLPVVSLVSVSSCAHSTLTSTTDRPPLRKGTTTTVPSTTTAVMPSGVPTCLGVVQVPNTRPTISLEGLLLTSTGVPNGYTSVGPQTTGAAGPEFTASFPSTVPVAYINFERTVQAVGVVPTTYGISETIGEEDSAQVAAQLVSRMKGQCPPFQITLRLPGSVPDLVVDGDSSEGSRGQGLASARLLTTKGPYVIDIRWSTNTESYAFPAAPPPFATPPEMGLVADEALSHIPG
jgi:hypothetical protein